MQYSVRTLFISIAVLAGSLALFASQGLLGIPIFCAVAGFVVALWRPWLAWITFTIWCLGLLSFPVVSLVGHPVPLFRLEMVKRGMHQEQVRRILGNPTHATHSNNGEAVWCYSGGTWCIVYVAFTSEGKVEGVNHDH